MKKLIPFVLLLFVTVLTAQEVKHLNLEDAVLGYYKGLYPERKTIQWIENTDDFIVSENDQVQVNYNLSRRPALFGLEDLQKAIPSLKSMPRSFSMITPETVYFDHDNAMIQYNYIDKTISSEIKYSENAENTEFNSSANAVAYTIENNLYVATASNSMIAVTSSEDKNIVSGQAIARSEMGITKGTFWSPNGNLLAFYQKDETNVTEYPLVDVTTTPATLNNIKYPMNGMGSEIAKAGIYSMKNNSVVYLDIDTSDEHYITNLSWSPNEENVFVAEVNRDQNHYWFTMYDATTGKKVKTLFEEKNDKWVEPEHTAVFLPNSNTEFLWLSERDGFMNLYLYDVNTVSYTHLTLPTIYSV